MPPTPCLVSTSRAFPGAGAARRGRNELPLWLRAHGLQLQPELHGVVLRWARLTSGDWLAEVQLAIPTGHGAVPITTWVSQQAVRAV
ncbi:hypothetical protein [Tsukamurella paurometabola]|uniref:Uncharacterized protein n=1 Tax=Tsukamurella paurometabola TaxID=2061 RepID=A0A3P8L1U3_TSUPA|nr:hypothetical protein [Tsukamurella paurometabola]UEA81619.1 hypothetical protein LK411_14565 [Tsukamurella paurometabola]VDR38625.1 Uncharacterised protein [Tsukamurella paurometabola]